MSLRILIADDEPLIRVDLRETLERLGYSVAGEAKDGKEALKLIMETKPDIVMLDIKMPLVDGLTVARKVSGKYPVIMVTAFSERDLIRSAQNSGVMAYLTKPFREGDILPAIELALKHFIEKSDLSDQVSRLKQELETRKLVERAKGILVQSRGLTEAEAYRHIQKISMDKNRSMKEVAEAIILMWEE